MVSGGSGRIKGISVGGIETIGAVVTGATESGGGVRIKGMRVGGIKTIGAVVTGAVVPRDKISGRGMPCGGSKNVGDKDGTGGAVPPDSVLRTGALVTGVGAAVAGSGAEG